MGQSFPVYLELFRQWLEKIRKQHNKLHNNFKPQIVLTPRCKTEDANSKQQFPCKHEGWIKFFKFMKIMLTMSSFPRLL